MRKALAILAALSAGCSTMMSHKRVAGWPELQVVEHHVSHTEMRNRCQRYVGFGMVPVACAEFDLAARRCHVWYSVDSPPARAVIEHELLHCAGYDHIGSTGMERLLERYAAAVGGPATGSAAAGSSR
jgi:hypothetical protein